MTVTDRQIDEWLRGKEDEHLEFKEAKNNFHFDKLVKYCAALANEGGGSIVLGVTDKLPRQVVGSQVFTDLERAKAGLIVTFFDNLWQTINLRNDKQHYQEGFVMHHIDTFREGSVREAILNAVSHREYRHPGSVFVRQYPRRLEIVSPGGLPTGITPDNMIDKQFPRNRRIAESLLRCGLVERSGQGANRMLVESVRDSKPLPDYSRSDEHEVFLRLHGDVQDTRFVRFLPRVESQRSTPFSSHEFLALDLVRRGASLPAKLREVGQALRKAGLIESQGHGRGSHFVLSPELYERSRQPQLVDRDAAKATILKYIEEHRAEGSTVGELLEQFPPLSRDQMKALLKDLKAEGKAHTVGRTKGGRWHPGEASE